MTNQDLERVVLGVRGSGANVIGAPAALILVLALLAAACGSNGDGETAPASGGAPRMCVDRDGLLCQPSAFPFVTLAGATSDACAGHRLGECPDPPFSPTTAHLTQPSAGKLCLSGSAAGTDGWAKIVLVFTTFNVERTRVLKVFDAEAAGITQAAFTLDSPPTAGVTLDMAVVTAADCPASPGDCFTYGFTLTTALGSGIPASFTAAGEVVAPLADFQQTRAGVSQTFDTTALHHLELIVGPGDYAFCIHDFKFLNAAGREVNP